MFQFPFLLMIEILTRKKTVLTSEVCNILEFEIIYAAICPGGLACLLV